MRALEEAIGVSGSILDPTTADLEGTLERSRLGLHALLKTPLMQEAIYVASPSFFTAIDDLLLDGEPGLKALRGAYRYVNRACRRPTPFGLFATVSAGTIDRNTKVKLGHLAEVKRHARLDFYAICRLVELQLRDPTEIAIMRFEPTSALYEACGRLRYSIANLLEGTTTPLLDLGASDALAQALAVSVGGVSAEKIAERIAATQGVSIENASSFVSSLIENGILLSSAFPSLTGVDPLRGAIARQADASKGRAILERAIEQLAALEKLPLGAPPSVYADIHRALSDAGVDVDANRVVQIDSTRPLAFGSLGTNVCDEILKATRVMHAIHFDGALETDLVGFRRRYDERYGGREMQLAQVLDEELGIGFGSSDRLENELLGNNSASESASVLDPAIAALLLDKVVRALRCDESEIVLNADELPSPHGRSVPDAFSAWVHLLADDDTSVDAGEFKLLLRGLVSPSGVQFLARFCGFHEALRNAVEKQLQRETGLRPNALLADVVHLPQGRTANIMLRPSLRQFEIVYLASSEAPVGRRINISDLMVSVSKERVHLRSAKHDREVLVRVTNGHLLGRAGFPIYRFLSALQNQDRTLGTWSWGSLEGSPFLPRVVTGRTILAPAQWRFDAKELASLSILPSIRVLYNLRRLRETRRLPRHVVIAEVDNWLSFDLDHLTSAVSFAAALRRIESPIVLEDLTRASFLASSEGRHANELIVPFLLRNSPANAAETKITRASDAIEGTRTFVPGSEVLSLNVYVDEGAMSSVLAGSIAPVARELISSGVAQRWFFERVEDPYPHLAIRLVGSSAEVQSKALPEIKGALEPWLSSGRLWRLQLDTYERKLERYGGALETALAESLFHADSEASIAALEAFEESEGVAWVLALGCAHRLLDFLQSPMDERERLLRRMSATCFADLQLTSSFIHGHGKMFRERRAELEKLVGGAVEETTYAPAVRIYEECLAVHGAPFTESLRSNTVSRLGTLDAYLRSCCSRLLARPARAQEMLTYHSLWKLYDGAVSRMRPKPTR